MDKQPRMTPFAASLLCDDHLLQEHDDIHMIVQIIEGTGKIEKFIVDNAIEPRRIKKRHDEITQELRERTGICLVSSIHEVNMHKLFGKYITEKTSDERFERRIEYCDIQIDDFYALKEVFQCKKCLERHLNKLRQKIREKYGTTRKSQAPVLLSETAPNKHT